MTSYALPLGPPYIVRDDEFLTRSDVVLSEDTADLKDNNNNGGDVYGLLYTGINGVDVVPGEAITLPSGALLTLFEDGTFRYDPNGVVAENGVDEVDTFTYTARPVQYVAPGEPEPEPLDPVTATVEIIVQAADRPAEAFLGDDSDDEFAGGVGNDLFEGGAGKDKLFGRDGDDVLLGGADNDQLFGGNGNDVLRGGSGRDKMYGGVGDDVYIVDDRNDWIFESQTSNPFSQNKRFPGVVVPSDNILISDQLIEFSEDTDFVYMGPLISEPGLPVDDFGLYLQVVKYPGATPFGSARTDSGKGGFDTVYSYVSYTVPLFVEKLVLMGDEDIDARGTGMDDQLYGNAGANILRGGGGADLMVGSGGNDSYYVDSADDVTIENTAEGNDTVLSSIDWTLDDNIENLMLEETLYFVSRGEWNSNGVFEITIGTAISATGNDLANTITGNSNDNVIDGRGGTDIMIGLTGNDRYHVDDSNDRVIEEARSGDDIVFASADYFLDDEVEILVLEGDAVTGHGNDGDNTIQGNDNANVLMGAGGTDYLLGGAGDDIFVITKLGDSDVDVIGDFEGAGTAGGDRLAFSAADFGMDGTVTQVSQTSFIVARADGSNAQQFIIANLEAGNGGLSVDDYYFG